VFWKGSLFFGLRRISSTEEIYHHYGERRTRSTTSGLAGSFLPRRSGSSTTTATTAQQSAEWRWNSDDVGTDFQATTAAGFPAVCEHKVCEAGISLPHHSSPHSALHSVVVGDTAGGWPPRV